MCQLSKVVFLVGCSLMLSRVAYCQGGETVKFTFDETDRPANWGVNFGHWEPDDGVLVCRQLDKDNHAAASRLKIPMADGVVSARVKLGSANMVHIGFDPAPGTLDKKGHLYSLTISQGESAIKRHKDKSDPKSSDKVLVRAQHTLDPNAWIDVTLKSIGERVEVHLEQQTGTGSTVSDLAATDPTFGVAKPAVVFRVIGGEAQLDDVEVTVTKGK